MNQTTKLIEMNTPKGWTEIEAGKEQGHGLWACACIKRDKAGKLKSIKLHPNSTKRCKVCKANKPSRREA